MSCLMGSALMLARAAVTFGRAETTSALTRSFPSGPVRTAMFPPGPSRTLILRRSVCTVILAVADAFRAIWTRPSCAKSRGGARHAAATAAPLAIRNFRRETSLAILVLIDLLLWSGPRLREEYT